MDLRIEAVAKANDLPDLGAPSEGEGFASFIRRKAVAAFEKKDWETLFTLLSVYSQVSGGGCARTNDMKQGVAAFLAGQQLEKAGQFSNASRNWGNSSRALRPPPHSKICARNTPKPSARQPPPRRVSRSHA